MDIASLREINACKVLDEYWTVSKFHGHLHDWCANFGEFRMIKKMAAILNIGCCRFSLKLSSLCSLHQQSYHVSVLLAVLGRSDDMSFKMTAILNTG